MPPRNPLRPACSAACYAAIRRVGYVRPDGYLTIGIDGKRVRVHRLAVETALGRKLAPTEHVHHIDGDVTNNVLSNLAVLSAGEHAREHHPLGWDIELAKALKESGLSFNEIGERFGVTGESVFAAFKRRGLTAPRVAGITPDILAEARRLLDSGARISEVAKRLGFNRNSIRIALARNTA